jgi:hypothetical protein
MILSVCSDGFGRGINAPPDSWQSAGKHFHVAYIRSSRVVRRKRGFCAFRWPSNVASQKKQHVSGAAVDHCFPAASAPSGGSSKKRSPFALLPELNKGIVMGTFYCCQRCIAVVARNERGQHLPSTTYVVRTIVCMCAAESPHRRRSPNDTNEEWGGQWTGGTGNCDAVGCDCGEITDCGFGHLTREILRCRCTVKNTTADGPRADLPSPGGERANERECAR